MPTLREMENQLFESWKAPWPGRFVTDGVPDEDSWSAAPKRVMLLLKEPYGASEGAGGWDLRDGITDDDRISGHTWNNASRWAALAQSGGAVRWEDVQNPSQPQKLAILRSCAIVNVKKLAGGARTNRRALLDAARTDRERLHQQFALYRPDITLLCGTAECLGPLFGDSQGDRKVLGKGNPEIAAREVPGLGIAIRVPHPQVRGLNAHEFFERLKDAIQKIPDEFSL